MQTRGNTLRDSFQDTSRNQLPKKLSKSDIASSLSKLGCKPFIPDSTENDKTPVCYFYGRAVLFQPCTDNPLNTQCKLPGVGDVFSKALEADPNLLTDKDYLVFPLFEEYTPWMARWNRNQWVLLVYSFAEKEFFLLDPTKETRFSCYTSNLKQLEEHLQTAFFTNIGNIKLSSFSLNLQLNTDTDSGGHWILYLIFRLTRGASLANLKTLSKQTPALTVEKINATLTTQFNQLVENPVTITAEEIDPEHGLQGLPDPVDIEAIKRQFTPAIKSYHNSSDYGALSLGYGRPGLVRSLHSVHPAHARSAAETNVVLPPPPSNFFILHLYSLLMFAGVAATLVAMFCLASTTTPVVSASVSTGILAVGVVMFVAGALGKCGLFSKRSRPPEMDEPTINLDTSMLTELPI